MERKKFCTGCQIAKPRTEYNQLTKGRISIWCTACTRSAPRRSKEPKHYPRSEERKLYERSRRLFRAYGITLDDYRRMRIEQGFRCAICKQRTLRTMAVDHCHLTGKVRGLLCLTCNRALGLFHDDPDRLMAAVGYLLNQGIE